MNTVDVLEEFCRLMRQKRYLGYSIKGPVIRPDTGKWCAIGVVHDGPYDYRCDIEDEVDVENVMQRLEEWILTLPSRRRP